MIIDKLLSNQSVIISIDVDNFLFEKLQQIADAGFTLVEVNTTDEQSLTQIISKFPTLKIGAQGVISTEQLEQCYQAGVHFASSPGFLPAIAQTANVYSMNYIPGVATVSEAMAAISIGFQQVRPFPANLAFCNILNKCFPKLNLFPAEIEWDEAEHFLYLPTVAAITISNPNKKQLSLLSSVIVA